MFPLFHLGVPLALSEIPYIRRKFKINRFALLVGAIIPDVIDKLLYFIGIGPGRFICHTLLFLFGSSLVLFLFTQLIEYVKASPKEKSAYFITMSFFAGMSIHLLLDLPKLPLFYPFIPYMPIPEGDKLASWIHKLLTHPNYISTELIGATLIIVIVNKKKLYHPKEMWNYLTLTS